MGSWQNLKLALRILSRAPGYSFSVVALVGLAVTAGSVLFTVYKGALLDPWPYEGGERLLVFRGDYPAIDREEYPLWSARDYAELAGFDAVFDHVIAGRGHDVNLVGVQGAERVLGAVLTPNTFAMLGIRPLHGRVLTAADADPAATPAVLIGHGLWQRRFGGDPAAVGQTLPIDGVPHTVVGVMPPRFLWWGSELWLPLKLDVAAADRGDRRYAIQARLGKDVDIAQANAALAAWAGRIELAHAAEYPEYRGWSARAGWLVDAVLRDVRDALFVLLIGVALLVLVAGFNVANLLLARAAERRREFAVRTALGASSTGMTWSLLVENGVLAALGALAGVVGAALCTDLVLPLIPYGYFPAEANVAVDIKVAAFAAGLALLVAVLAVLPVAASLRGLRVVASLHEARGTGTRSAVRLRSGFVIAQLAMATVVIAAAVATGSSFRGSLASDPGFVPEQAASMRISLPRHAYPDRQALHRFALALESRLGRVPGIDAAGIGTMAPLDGGELYPLSIRMATHSAELSSRYEVVAGDWFAALGLSTLAGRVFSDADGEDTQRVAVVNETFVQKYLGNSDPIGAQVRAGPGGAERDWLTIVGVVADTRVGGIDGEVRPLVYQPLAQSAAQLRNPVVLVRGVAPPADMVGSVRRAVAALDPGVPVHDVATFEQIVLDSLGGQRLAAWLLAGFGLSVLLLAALGVHGIVAYVTRLAGVEFGLRMALGATGGQIVRLVGRRSAVLALAGIGAGVVLAVPALRLLGSVLARPLPPILPVLSVSCALLALIVVVGCAGPAAAGGRTNPARALRDE